MRSKRPSNYDRHYTASQIQERLSNHHPDADDEADDELRVPQSVLDAIDDLDDSDTASTSDIESVLKF